MSNIPKDIPKDMKERYVSSIEYHIDLIDAKIKDTKEYILEYEEDIKIRQRRYIPNSKKDLEKYELKRKELVDLLQVAKNCKVVIEDG